MLRLSSFARSLGVVVAILLSAATARGQSFTVVAVAGPTSPTWAGIGETTTTPVSAVLVRAPSFVSGPTYIWSFPTVFYSPDNPGTTNPATGGYYAFFEDPNAAQTNFKAIGFNAGYWRFQLRVDIAGQVPMGYYGTNTVFCNASCEADPVVAGPLIVKRKKDGEAAYKVIGAGNKDVLPGEFMDLKAEDAAAGALTDVKWTISAKSFKDYAPTDTTGVLTLLVDADLSVATVAFYWADSGDKVVTVKATVGGKPMSGKETFSVKKPAATFTVVQGVIYLGPYKIDGKKVFGMVLAHDKSGITPGMDFTGKVTVPAGFPEGTWCCVQVLTGRTAMTAKFDDGTIVKMVRTSGGEYVLDSGFPYSEERSTGGTDGKEYDSPGYNTGFAQSIFQEYEAAFKMYVLFKPAGKKSMYVSLRRLDWKFKGKMEKTAGKWKLVPKSTAKSKEPAVDDTTHPEWDKKFFDIQAKPVK